MVPTPALRRVGEGAANVVTNADDRGPRDHVPGEALTQAERTGTLHAVVATLIGALALSASAMPS
jgi:hypothetical protein